MTTNNTTRVGKAIGVGETTLYPIESVSMGFAPDGSYCCASLRPIAVVVKSGGNSITLVLESGQSRIGEFQSLVAEFESRASNS